ncbi:MAG: hypothetical protein KKE17_12210 [Proteobacteria bacterium]|nr:hypothetical protein [Pseudomonadota bacterium]MBU1710761.1 hypothetical protein [Pseudomonadota bacterium]
MKFNQLVFSKGSIGLDAVKVFLATGAFVITMIDAVMLFFLADIYQTFITPQPSE